MRGEFVAVPVLSQPFERRGKQNPCFMKTGEAVGQELSTADTRRSRFILYKYNNHANSRQNYNLTSRAKRNILFFFVGEFSTEILFFPRRETLAKHCPSYARDDDRFFFFNSDLLALKNSVSSYGI